MASATATAAVGLPNGRRRRTPGLRREEVAELAGIGVDWYIRLKQGRTVSPSVSTIDALARALRLGKAEHRHFKALTQSADRRAFAPETVPAAVRRTVESLNLPAYGTGRRWDLLAWNAAADELFGFSRLPEAERNVLLCVLTNRATGGCSGGVGRRGEAHGGAVPRHARSVGRRSRLPGPAGAPARGVSGI
jgi:transcriptional regulator with XRE-family HTH domain